MKIYINNIVFTFFWGCQATHLPLNLMRLTMSYRTNTVKNGSKGGLAEHVASHFISAKVKSFSFSELEKAKKWIVGDENK